MRRRRNRRGDKAKAQMRHAGQRAWEREGFDFHYDRQIRVVKQIQDGDAEFIERQSGRVSLWWVTVDEQRLKVVYDKQRKTIVSVLPKEDTR